MRIELSIQTETRWNAADPKALDIRVKSFDSQVNHAEFTEEHDLGQAMVQLLCAHLLSEYKVIPASPRPWWATPHEIEQAYLNRLAAMSPEQFWGVCASAQSKPMPEGFCNPFKQAASDLAA